MVMNMNSMMNTQVRKDRLKLSQSPSIIAMDTVGFRVINNPQITNSSGTVTWSIWKNNIPSLTVDSATGAITIPSNSLPTNTSTLYYLGLTAKDSSGVMTRYRPFTFYASSFVAIDFTAPVIVSRPNEDFQVTQASTAVNVVSWTLSNIVKPSGFDNVSISIDSSGVITITGRATNSGSMTFDLTIVDQYQRSVTKSCIANCLSGNSFLAISGDSIVTDRYAIIKETSDIQFFQSKPIRAFLVGGGGSGGSGVLGSYGGQGGGSGYWTFTNSFAATFVSSTTSTYRATIGQRGNLPTASSSNGNDGTSTVLSKIDGTTTTTLLTALPGKAGGGSTTSTNISSTGIGWSNGGAPGKQTVWSGGLAGYNGFNTSTAPQGFTEPSSNGINLPSTLQGFKYLNLEPGKPGNSPLYTLSSQDGGTTWKPIISVPNPNSVSYYYNTYSYYNAFLDSFKTSYGYYVSVLGLGNDATNGSATNNTGAIMVKIDNGQYSENLFNYVQIGTTQYFYSYGICMNPAKNTVYIVGINAGSNAGTNIRQTIKIVFSKNKTYTVSVLSNGNTANILDIATDPYSGYYFTTSDNGALMRNTEGAVSPTTILTNSSITKKSITYLPEFDRYVIVGYSSSNDVVMWASRSSATTSAGWNTVTISGTKLTCEKRPAYSPSLQMLICNSGWGSNGAGLSSGSNAYMYSMDGGLTWTKTTFPANMYAYQIKWVPFISKFVAIGYDTTNSAKTCVMRSSDGLTWERIYLPSLYASMVHTSIFLDESTNEIHLFPDYVGNANNYNANGLNFKLPHGYPGKGFGAGGGGSSNFSASGVNSGGGGGGGVVINGFMPNTYDDSVLDFTKYGTLGSNGVVYLEWDPDPTPLSITDPSDPYFSNVSVLLYDTEVNNKANNEFYDSSPYNNPMTTTGIISQSTFTPYWNDGYWSLYFNGATGSYINTPFSTATTMGSNNFTIETWFKLENQASKTNALFWQSKASISVNGDQPISMSATVGGIVSCAFYDSSNAGITLNTTTTIVPNQWYHVAVTRNGNSFKLFLNGSLEASQTSSISINVGSANNYFGYRPGNDNFKLWGWLSNFRIINGTSIYDSSFQLPTTPLTNVTNTALLLFQSRNHVDNSLNQATITPNGSTFVMANSPFNGPIYDPEVHGGSAFTYSTTNSYTYIPANTIPDMTGPFTVELWFYPLANQADVTLIGSWNESAGSPGSWGLFYNTTDANSPLKFVAGPYPGGTQNGPTPAAIKNGSWNHIAVSRDQFGNFYFFVNGQQQTPTRIVNWSGTSWSDTMTFYNGSLPLRIGGGPNNKAPYGYVSDVRLVIGRAMYTKPFVPNIKPLETVANTAFHMKLKNTNIKDAANNAVITYSTAKTTTAVSKVGSTSLTFDGTANGRIFIPPAPQLSLGLSDFTIEFWMNATSLADTMRVMGYATGASWAANQWVIAPSKSGKIAWFCYNMNSSTPMLSSTTTTATNQWYHVAVVRSGTSLKLYIDGTLEASATSSLSLDGNTQNSLSLGWSNVSSDTGFVGYMDEVRITKGTARYTSNFTPPTLLPRR